MLPTNYANLLQSNSLRVVSNPHQTINVQRPSIGTLQARPAAAHLVAPIQGPTHPVNIQYTTPGFRLQPQRPFQQQQPQLGVTAWNLQHLANPNSASSFPAYNTSIGGVPMHVPAYSGYGWQLAPQALPLPQVSFPTFKKLNYIY